MKADLGGLMKQAQQMQARMEKMKEDIAKTEVQGEAGAGLIKVSMLGNHSVRRVEVDPALLEEDKEMLEDLLAAAVNDAVRKVEQLNADKMGSLTAGLPLPPGFKLPF